MTADPALDVMVYHDAMARHALSGAPLGLLAGRWVRSGRPKESFA